MTYEEKQFIKALERLGRVEDVKRAKPRCCRCGKYDHIQNHHITYTPPKTARLCARCHKLITVINTIGSIATGTKQNNEVRLRLWKWFRGTKNKVIKQETVLRTLNIDYEFNEYEKEWIKNAGQRISC